MRSLSFSEKMSQMPWGIIGVITFIVSIGIAMLYSAANGHFAPWALRQLMRFGLGLIFMFWVASIDIRRWLQFSYLFYGSALLLLILVEIMGFIGMGAQRWIDLYFISLQPSEIMKIALILALARYFSDLSEEEMNKPSILLPPVLLALIPVLLVMKQPDLGTALVLLMIGGCVFFAAGVSRNYFLGIGGALLAFIPIGWQFLHTYQKNRVLNFLNPEHDPLNTGYQILQSKIALGSGGFYGQGFLQGTQSHLNFLPAKQTDFIFTMFCEEFGFLGGLLLILTYLLLALYFLKKAVDLRSRFGRLVTVGITAIVLVYMMVNTAMVMGLAPVVGVPLPLITYGGTSLLTLMVGFGLIFSAMIHRS